MLTKIKVWIYIWVYKLFYGFANISTNLIYAQAVHETGNFTSDIFKENNNLFGMRQAKVRKNFATGTARGHATFKNLRDSVRDYFERQKNFNISNRNDSEFVNSTVASNYAEDARYKEKWLAVQNQSKSPLSTFMLLALFFFIVFLVWLIRAIWNTLFGRSSTRTVKHIHSTKKNFKTS